MRCVLRGAREAFARCGMLAFAGVYECGDARGVGRGVCCGVCCAGARRCGLVEEDRVEDVERDAE